MSCLVCCHRAAPTLLLHVAVLLSLFTGAGLATIARLKWDPTTYVFVRELFPTEYRVVGGVICIGSFVMFVLGHLSVLGVSIGQNRDQTIRRAILFSYAVVMTLLAIIELVTVSWFCVRIVNWLQSDEIALILNLHKDWAPIIKKGLGFFSIFSSKSQEILNTMQEVEDDIPANVYVFFACVAIVGVLQPLSIILAINSAYTYTKPSSKYRANTKIVNNISYTGTNSRPPSQAPPNNQIVAMKNKYESMNDSSNY